MKSLPAKKAAQATKLQLVRTGVKAGVYRPPSIRRIPTPGIGGR